MPEAVDQQQALDGGQVDLAFNLPSRTSTSMRRTRTSRCCGSPRSSTTWACSTRNARRSTTRRCARRCPTRCPMRTSSTVATAGLGTQARGPVPAGVFPYSEDTPQYTATWRRPRSCWPRPASTASTWSSTYAAENQNEARFAPLIKEAYAKLGVNVTFTPMPFNQQWERAKSDDPAGRQDMFLLLYWPTYSDAGSDNLWSLFHSSDAAVLQPLLLEGRPVRQPRRRGRRPDGRRPRCRAGDVRARR